MKLRIFLAVAVLLSAFVSIADTSEPLAPAVPVNPGNTFEVVDVQSIIRNLPKGERWIEHLNNDLLKFWDMKTALGDPPGDFPTYRCNDGSLYNPEHACQELKNADQGIVKLDREYTRAKSRQVFAYGISYHLTGEEKYLGYAKAGAEWLMANALDAYGAASWFKGGHRQPNNLQRTSQDMAYAVSGLAFFYYLTHDDEYLNGVIILTDMFGGTPSNLSYSFLEEGHIEVLSGVNLPILIQAANRRTKMDLIELAADLEAFGKKSISLASRILKGNKRS